MLNSKGFISNFALNPETYWMKDVFDDKPKKNI
jgi:hypothetical protein